LTFPPVAHPAKRGSIINRTANPAQKRVFDLHNVRLRILTFRSLFDVR
jgi:hypothetical protein